MKDQLCSKCNVCAFMPEQDRDRTLLFKQMVNEEYITLVIDDCQNQDQWVVGMAWASELLGHNIAFDFTSTVRCDYNPDDLTPEHQQEAIDKCGVWTNLLLERRAVILTTETGLRQMKVDSRPVGSVFRSTMLGIIVVLPPLHAFDDGLFQHYLPKVQRALKEVRLA